MIERAVMSCAVESESKGVKGRTISEYWSVAGEADAGNGKAAGFDHLEEG